MSNYQKWGSPIGIQRLAGARGTSSYSHDTDVDDYDTEPIVATSTITAGAILNQDMLTKVAKKLDENHIIFSESAQVNFSRRSWDSYSETRGFLRGSSWWFNINDGEKRIAIDNNDVH